MKRKAAIAVLVLIAVSILCFCMQTPAEPEPVSPSQEGNEISEIIEEQEIVEQVILEETAEEDEAEPEEIEVDDDDLELLAHLIMGEAGGSSEALQHLIGCVVINRVNSVWFPDTLYEVIYQDGQYACTWLGGINREPTEQCYEVARELLINGSDIPADVVWQAEFIQGSSIYLHLDNQYFCHK